MQIAGGQAAGPARWSVQPMAIVRADVGPQLFRP